MNFFLALVTLISVAIGIANGEKGNSIIPFPRVGRSGNSPGLIPFPRIGRDGGFHEMKRQLIPFPRVGKRAFWHLPVESAYYTEYEDINPLMVDPNFLPPPSSFQVESSPSEDGEVDKRGGTPATSSAGMWFGPRLGRRKKRSVVDTVAESSEHRGDTTIDMKPLLKMLHNSNWAIIVPVKERRNFTPRLGRSSHEGFTVHQRGQPFSPRLGRSGDMASPSIDEDEELETRSHVKRRPPYRDTTPDPIFDLRPRAPLSPRLGRSDPFSPRLGRADPFSPRLGRSGTESTQPDDSRDRK
ncbi:uncharacterized protein LOC110845107 isoform X2 [Folsomia candida]|uniref:uncharacterized protein LOC110845107 isoform X2 n=1 Tax=Folsomia candida TaxID=158441 RepID=UPI001604DCA4|nr:uncharacterized protein LOC110845107 isoform X2 [Folsomia candida]